MAIIPTCFGSRIGRQNACGTRCTHVIYPYFGLVWYGRLAAFMKDSMGRRTTTSCYGCRSVRAAWSTSRKCCITGAYCQARARLRSARSHTHGKPAREPYRRISGGAGWLRPPNWGRRPGLYRIHRWVDPATPVSLIIPTRGTSGSVWGERRCFIVETVRSALARPDDQYRGNRGVRRRGDPQGCTRRAR